METPQFHSTEELFAKLLNDPSSTLSAGDVDEINEFVQVQEFALALETALAIFMESGKAPVGYQNQLLEQLASEFDIAPRIAEAWAKKVASRANSTPD